jgi:hypothetical protein
VASPFDITIHWANKETYDRFAVAVQVQDAGNLLALSREFVKVVDQAMAETGSTEKTWADPAVRLFVNKFESLCRSEANYGEAYAECLRRSK